GSTGGTPGSRRLGRHLRPGARGLAAAPAARRTRCRGELHRPVAGAAHHRRARGPQRAGRARHGQGRDRGPPPPGRLETTGVEAGLAAAARATATIPAMLDLDARVILPDAQQYNAALVRRDDAHESLSTFWVRFDAEATPFLAGQYMTIGVFVQDAALP